MYRLYADPISGNCYKAALMLHLTGRPFEVVETSVLNGHTRTPAFLAMNSNGRIPLLEDSDGGFLSESNAILLSLARGMDYRPDEPAEEARMFEWLFFEQYNHEPNIATARFWTAFRGVPENRRDILAEKREAGHGALAVMENALARAPFLVADRFTVADIALYAYTHVAEDGGFDLKSYPAVRAWLDRVAREPGVKPMRDLFADAPTRPFDPGGAVAARA